MNVNKKLMLIRCFKFLSTERPRGHKCTLPTVKGNQSQIWTLTSEKFRVSSSVLCHQHNSAPRHSSLARRTQRQKYLLDPSARRWPLSLAHHDSLSIRGGLRDGPSVSVRELYRNKCLENRRKNPERAAAEKWSFISVTRYETIISSDTPERTNRCETARSQRPSCLSGSALQHRCASCLINIRLLSWLKGTPASEPKNKQIQAKQGGHGPYFLFTAAVCCRHGIQRILPSCPWGLVLTDRQRRWRRDNTSPSSKMDKTCQKRCPDIIGVNERRVGGYSRHQFVQLTGAVTELIINANEEASQQQQQHKKGRLSPQQ